VVDSVRGAFSASARIRNLEKENERLRTQLERPRWRGASMRRATSRVNRNLGDMQSQIARLKQDLFILNRVWCNPIRGHSRESPADAKSVPETVPCQFRLKFVLMQTGKPDTVVAGSAAINRRRAAGGASLQA